MVMDFIAMGMRKRSFCTKFMRVRTKALAAQPLFLKWMQEYDYLKVAI